MFVFVNFMLEFLKLIINKLISVFFLKKDLLRYAIIPFFLFLIYVLVSIRYNSIEYVYDFQQAAALYAYHLVALHNSIMYYVFIILVLVYWCLYKILRDFTWNIFNKQIGFFRFFFKYKIFLYLEYFLLVFL